MSDIAIKVEGLSKQYRIGEQQEKYGTMRDTISKAIATPFRATRRRFQRSRTIHTNGNNKIWALRDISFEIKRGEVVGIIGSNGAGKSTLLKILSRITEPTTGYADLSGRVGSLLEVGTGFHHELTGRENIYFNGAILGMKRSEIDRKFEQIVEFAEVGKFIDTPVKHYSSGMHLRLGFAVAAHLEPDILFVDEVLAVGDIRFQQKCLGKMEDVAAEGRTVLFVSHNLAAVKALCQTSIVLNNGKMGFRGPAVEGLAQYSRNMMQDEQEAGETGTGWRFISVNGLRNEVTTEIVSNQPFFAEAQLDINGDFSTSHLGCEIKDSVGRKVVFQVLDSRDMYSRKLTPGRYQIRAQFPLLWLAPDIYTLHFKFRGRNASGVDERHFSERAILEVTKNGDEKGYTKSLLSPDIQWNVSSQIS